MMTNYLNFKIEQNIYIAQISHKLKLKYRYKFERISKPETKLSLLTAIVSELF